MSVSTGQQRHYMVGQVRGHRELAPVQSGIAPADDAVARGDLERNEVAAGTGHDDVGAFDTERAHLASTPTTSLRRVRQVRPAPPRPNPPPR
jgi:hypothetical protein